MRFSLSFVILSGLSALALTGCSAEGLEYASNGGKSDASVGPQLQDESAGMGDDSLGASACTVDSPGLAPDVERAVEPIGQPVPDSAVCPQDMVLVEGSHCTKVDQKCLDYMEDPITNPYARCRVFEEPTVCKGEKVEMQFCIDRLEVAGDDGLPVADKSWTEAKQTCEARGKRLCQEREWLFACEGEEARPYPYGYVRSPDLCNFELTEGLVTLKGDLADHRQPVTANPHCLSPFGVQNMVGNIDEWVVLDKPHFSTKGSGKRMMSGLKGGWWGPLRNRCRPTTVDHDEVFHELQTGIRCCKDAGGQ